MKILVIGQGAREHAVVHSLCKDADVEVHCAPGNPGIAVEAQVHSINPVDNQEVLTLAQELEPDLVVIGPEAPLVAGVADVLREHGYLVFGPSAAAAALEGSKAFAKEVMMDAGVPTADSRYCTTAEQVNAALDLFGPQYVVKDDGLVAGKGVVVTPDRDVAFNHALSCINRTAQGAVVIEEYLDGPEVSLFGVTDGKTIVPLSPAQDFKRVGDNDSGPNTGGMGAYTPLPWAPSNLVEEAQRTVLEPMIREMNKRGTPFVGLLYAGLALTSRGLRVIEFNARFGDPETQVVLARLKSPLSQLLFCAANGTLDQFPELEWQPQAAITVVLAAAGYPEAPITGAAISGIEAAENIGTRVFHAGTKVTDGQIVVNGGRVLCVTAVGADLTVARKNAYAGVQQIHFDGEHHRSDIALRAANGEVVVP